MESGEGRSAVGNMLDETLCDDPDIEFVVAFGSRTTGTASPSSDLDIAIKFADGLSANERFRKWCFLAGDLQGSSRPHVDVADIERLPIAVAHDAVSGQLVCGDESTFHQFRRAIEERYSGERDRLREHRQTVLDRIAEEGLRG